jgi:hypothetical protein
MVTSGYMYRTIIYNSYRSSERISYTSLIELTFVLDEESKFDSVILVLLV